MSIKKFIEDKLKLIKKDKQSVFSDMVDPLARQIEDAPEASTFEIPVDGNWFKLSFTALEVKKDRLVIDAERIKNGFFGDQYIGRLQKSDQAVLARRKRAEKRSLHGVNEHFPLVCNAASAASAGF